MSFDCEAKGDAPIHATAIAGWRAGRWRGVLVCGPSGSGKSGLAMRAMAAGWALVCDDRTMLWTSADRLFGAAQAALAGLLEVRGHGVVRRPVLRSVQIVLVVQSGVSERMPEPRTVELAGLHLPLVVLDFGAPGAVMRLDLALDAALRPSTLL